MTHVLAAAVDACRLAAILGAGQHIMRVFATPTNEVFEREIARIDIALLALQNTRLALRALPLHLAWRPLQKIARRTREMLSLRKFYAARIARNAAQEGA